MRRAVFVFAGKRHLIRYLLPPTTTKSYHITCWKLEGEGRTDQTSRTLRQVQNGQVQIFGADHDVDQVVVRTI
jgi:hypothetical protein